MVPHLPSGSTYTPSEVGNELDMELGEEEEELRDGGSEGGSKEASPMEDRCVMAPWSLGWAQQGGAPLPGLQGVSSSRLAVCLPLFRVPVICM